MSETPQTSETYDAMYREGGYEGVFALPTKHSHYYPLQKAMLRIVKRSGTHRLLEVGCGAGAFAELVLETGTIVYSGFDFSSVAVENAAKRTGRPDLFKVGDATRPESYDSDYDCIACAEVLEHVEADLEIVRLWKSGTFCVCSVPNFDSRYHVRHFRAADEVRARYGDLIEIEGIRKIKKYVLPDISWSNRLKHMIWHRWKPKRLWRYLGLGRFDDVGGWFLFHGRRR